MTTPRDAETWDRDDDVSATEKAPGDDTQAGVDRAQEEADEAEQG